MGVFAGAATACCAPVLAGAIAIAGVSGSWWAGAVLGLFYLFGLVSPLLLSAAGIGKLRGRVRDPRIAFSLAGRRVRMTLSRLVGGIAFIILRHLRHRPRADRRGEDRTRLPEGVRAAGSERAPRTSTPPSPPGSGGR